ncbi:MAG: UbiD family decarboxylase [Chloroflexota bacterium]
MNKDLRTFLKVVKEAGPDYYVEVKKPLNPILEPFILQQKLFRKGRFPVIFCPEIKGSRIPLVTGLTCSYELLGLALDMDPKKMDKAQISQEFRRRVAKPLPTKMVPASQAPVKEVILKGKDIDLGLLPLTQHHELDSGKYLIIGPLLCKDPDTGIMNAGIYRHELKGKDKLACDLAPAHHAAHIARRHAELGRPMEVAIVVGHHPAMEMAAAAPGQIDMNELEMMGGLLGEPVEVVKGETVDLEIPAGAEMVLEGVLDTPVDGTVTDSPFAEYTYYYGRGDQPAFLMRITAITMRKNPIYRDLDPGHPEHNLTSVLSAENSVFDSVKKVVPSVKAVHIPVSGVKFHTYVSIKKRVPGEGKLAGIGALAGYTFSKMVVVVDEDVDVFNEQDVLWAMATRVVADRDVSIISEAMGQRLDPSAYDENRTGRGYLVSKMIIDATMPVEIPFATRVTPKKELWERMQLEDYLK